MDRTELEIAGCLRRLFRSRYILRTRNERWFQSIVDNRRRIDEVLATFGANLELNEPLGVAAIRATSAEIEEQLNYRLSRTKILSAFASAMLLHLRWLRLQFYLQPTGDDLPLVSVADLREFLSAFSKSAVDLQYERQFRRALDELIDLQVLIETAEGSGFFEITSLCDLLLPADQIQELRSRASAYFSSAVPDGEDVLVR